MPTPIPPCLTSGSALTPAAACARALGLWPRSASEALIRSTTGPTHGEGAAVCCGMTAIIGSAAVHHGAADQGGAHGRQQQSLSGRVRIHLSGNSHREGNCRRRRVAELPDGG